MVITPIRFRLLVFLAQLHLPVSVRVYATMMLGHSLHDHARVIVYLGDLANIWLELQVRFLGRSSAMTWNSFEVIYP